MRVHKLIKEIPEGMFPAPHAQVILAILKKEKNPIETKTLVEKVLAKLGDTTRAKNYGQAVSNYLVDFRKGGFLTSVAPEKPALPAKEPKSVAKKTADVAKKTADVAKKASPKK